MNQTLNVPVEVTEADTINSNETVIMEVAESRVHPVYGVVIEPTPTDEVESTLVDAEVGETLPEELPEVTVSDTLE